MAPLFWPRIDDEATSALEKTNSSHEAFCARVVYSDSGKMSVLQRCPEEVDVFTLPHLRMKQIVGEVSEKLSATDFQDSVSLNGLLSCVDAIFHELKRHEEIENKYIMGQLQRRLTNEQISAIVSEIHKDSHVPEILSLVKKGFKTSMKRSYPHWSGFRDKLMTAMAAFQKDFLPHMKHEEQVFQPLLMEYFSFEELKEIKAEVLSQHFTFRECATKESRENDSCIERDSGKKTDQYSDIVANILPPIHTLRTKHDKHQENILTKISGDENDIPPCSRGKERLMESSKLQTLITDLPSEVLMKIFSLLGPKDLCRCAQVCTAWSHWARDGLLWDEMYPVRWIINGDWRFGWEQDEICGCDDVVHDGCTSLDGSLFVDADAALSSDTYEDDDENSELAIKTHQFLGLVRYLLPLVGSSVRLLKLGCCPVLSNGLAFKILSHCPNLRYLDVTQTAVSDLGLNGLFRKGGGGLLEHLDVSGCKNITDKTLVKLSSALVKKNTDSVSDIEDSGCECVSGCQCQKYGTGNLRATRKGLVHLGLSGCYQITDVGLRALAKHGAVSQLQHLDLSGCLGVTAQGLLGLVATCPELDHSEFYYCDNIDEGPYPDTASGCQNLQCKHRICCRTGE